ncbi:hypothetical protein CR205_11875 [Alteribacter lacisalsi]|uniref:Uncharacterized protein n=1 Tax=Alteribacter lacisalsi TaxID=2045244 RepID=A0A2W0HG91_9BACI|nr:hypothetical protein [Alteribacter lacisalsi]PYZ96415.1 hypothetical protein CR205_11875 [Alteribacter lacisalsi]
MRQEWKQLMKLKGKSLVELAGSRFVMVRDKGENAMRIQCPEPFIHWAVFSEDTGEAAERGFWRLNFTENQFGEDILLLHEQGTPEPLNYIYNLDDLKKIDSHIAQKHVYVMETSYSFSFSVIKEISGYGFFNQNEALLYTLLIETKDEFLLIESCPAALDIKITEHPPSLPNHPAPLTSLFTTN